MTANSTKQSTPLPSAAPDTVPKPAPTSANAPAKAKPPAKPAAVSNGTSPDSSTDSSKTHQPTPEPPLHRNPQPPPETRFGNHRSIIGAQLGAPESLHQSRKGDRIPCGTASIPFARTSLEIVELDSGFPAGDGNTSSVASAALLMMFRAGLFRGTRCGRPVLVRSPGISHVSVVRSISSHAVL